jgi:hypothetical protein
MPSAKAEVRQSSNKFLLQHVALSSDTTDGGKYRIQIKMSLAVDYIAELRITCRMAYACYLLHAGSSLIYSSNLKMEAIFFSETC